MLLVQHGRVFTMIAPSLSLHDVLASYIRERYALAPATAAYYKTMVDGFCRWHGGVVLLNGLSADSLRDYFRACLAAKQPARTVNDRRQVLLMLWRFAHEKGWKEPPPRIPKVREPRRCPTAFSPEEMSRLLRACAGARPVGRCPGWSSAHWRALCLVAYDTALRIGALLTVPRKCCDLERRTLFVPGELQKNRMDSLHRLHPQTCEAIAEMPADQLLFPWPYNRREIWKQFRKILRAAKLPDDRRGMFHKLRRTAYTQTYKALGPLAAMKHAGHSTDLSRYYLDVSFLDDVSPVDVIPRP